MHGVCEFPKEQPKKYGKLIKRKVQRNYIKVTFEKKQRNF